MLTGPRPRPPAPLQQGPLEGPPLPRPAAPPARRPARPAASKAPTNPGRPGPRTEQMPTSPVRAHQRNCSSAWHAWVGMWSCWPCGWSGGGSRPRSKPLMTRGRIWRETRRNAAHRHRHCHAPASTCERTQRCSQMASGVHDRQEHKSIRVCEKQRQFCGLDKRPITLGGPSEVSRPQPFV